MGRILEYFLGINDFMRNYKSRGQRIFRQSFGEIRSIPERPQRGYTIEEIVQVFVDKQRERARNASNYDFSTLC